MLYIESLQNFPCYDLYLLAYFAHKWSEDFNNNFEVYVNTEAYILIPYYTFHMKLYLFSWSNLEVKKWHPIPEMAWYDGGLI